MLPIPTIPSTPLPTVVTQVPYGLVDVTGSPPYVVALVPPPQSDATPSGLEQFLNDKSDPKRTFKVKVLASSADVLTALCSDMPTFGWVDGWTLLAALNRGCGQPVLKVQRQSATGVRADIVVAQASKVTALSGLRQLKEFCRLKDDKTATSWLLPVLMIRSDAKFDPIREYTAIRTFTDIPSMLKAMVPGKCVGAVPSGTLSSYSVDGVSDVNRTFTVLKATPEIPFGGLVIGNRVPKDVADGIIQLFVKNPDQLKGLVDADKLLDAKASDYNTALQFLQQAGFDFQSLGQF